MLKLMALGFIPVHNEVYNIPVSDSMINGMKVEVDFTFILEECFIAYAIKKVYEAGVEAGEKKVKRRIASFMNECKDAENS